MASAHPPEGMSPVPARPVRRIRARRLILAGAVLLILLVGFEIGIRQVSPDAVQVSTATTAQGDYFATRAITDARIVADLFARVNGLPSAGLGAILFPPCRLPPRPDALMYSFRFTRGSLPVEVATLVEQGCSVWEFIRGGIPGARNDPTGRQTQAILDEAQPLPK